MKKNLFLMSLVALIFLGACTSSNGSDGNNSDSEQEIIELEFWHAMAGPHEAAIEALVERFHLEHSHIRINHSFQGSYSDLNTLIASSALADTLPHIGQQTTDNITNYVNDGILIPLTSFFAELPENDINDIVEVFRDGIVWNDEFYSVPFAKSTRVLYVNLDLLAAYNLEIPTTWDEVIHIAQILRNQDQHQFGMGFENSWAAEFVALTIQHGGEYIDENTATARFADDGGISAANFIMDLYKNDYIRFAGEDNFLSGVFGNGALGMYIGTSSSFPHVTAAVDGDFEWTTAVLPTYQGVAASRFHGNDLVMFNNGMAEEEQQAVWTFMEFVLRPEENAQFAIDSGFIPVRYSAHDHAIWADFIEANPHAAAGALQFDSGFITARVRGASEAWQILIEELDNIRLEIDDIDVALTRAQMRINEVLNR